MPKIQEILVSGLVRPEYLTGGTEICCSILTSRFVYKPVCICILFSTFTFESEVRYRNPLCEVSVGAKSKIVTAGTVCFAFF